MLAATLEAGAMATLSNLSASRTTRAPAWSSVTATLSGVVIGDAGKSGLSGPNGPFVRVRLASPSAALRCLGGRLRSTGASSMTTASWTATVPARAHLLASVLPDPNVVDLHGGRYSVRRRHGG
jgi:hypothetical protein